MWLVWYIIYIVGVQTYYWLWPGGRHDQAVLAAFKQDIGHNPVDGLDRCAAGDRIGMSLAPTLSTSIEAATNKVMKDENGEF